MPGSTLHLAKTTPAKGNNCDENGKCMNGLFVIEDCDSRYTSSHTGRESVVVTAGSLLRSAFVQLIFMRIVPAFPLPHTKLAMESWPSECIALLS